MLKHDLMIALRRCARQRFHTAVGVAVLALGLVCFIATNLFVSYVRNFDRQWPNADRAYVVAERTDARDFGLISGYGTRSDGVVAEHLRVEAPELAAVARLHRIQRAISAEEQRLPLMVGYVEPQFTNIFELPALAGDSRQALAAPRSAVITRRTAERLFGSTDVAGRSITLAVQQPVDLTVRAVIEDLPAQSHLGRGLLSEYLDLLVSWDVLETFEPRTVMAWGAPLVKTFALLPASGTLTPRELDRRLATIAAERVPPEMRVLGIDLEARPVSSMAAIGLQTLFEGYYGGGEWVDILSVLRTAGAVILAIACLNFLNLAMAEGATRAVDVSTRKVLGATTRQIVRQDLLQTGLAVLLALLVAVALIVPLSRLLDERWSASLAVPWREPSFIAFLAGTLAAVTVAAGLYPALVAARARRTAASSARGASDALARLRTILVGFQFAAGSALVVAAVVLLMQRNELHHALVGRFADQYIGFWLDQTRPIAPEVLERELERGPGIKGTTASISIPFTNQQRAFGRAPGQAAPRVMVDFLYTGHDYFSVMDVPLAAGRVFAPERNDDLPDTSAEWAALQGRGAPIVLDRAAARSLGWPDPAAAVGQLIYAPGDSRYEIVGVVERAPASVRAAGTEGTAYVFAPALGRFRIVRVASDRAQEALAHIHEVMNSLAPGRPLAPAFFDAFFESAYYTFDLTNRVLTGLAVFALLISGIGLFGMASYFANRRTREIGIRKVQGATPANILRLLLWDLSRPVVWANLAAWPLVLLALDRYLSLFAERVSLTPLPFVIALAATWLLACIAVGSCAWRAARLHPAAALRE